MVNELRCAFCARTFREEDAQPACAACPLRGGCQLARCPHCGYENAVAPAWLHRVRDWFAMAASGK